MLTIIESPYAGSVERNLNYARACLADSIRRGEIPFASHLLYTQVLDDLKAEEREEGMALGFKFYTYADQCAVYADHGISRGMAAGMDIARHLDVPIAVRYLYPPITIMPSQLHPASG